MNDLGYVLCAALGCLWAIAGKIAVGNVQAMLEYTWRFAEPFSAIAGMVGSFGAAAAAGNRIFGLLDAEEEIPDSDQCIVPDDRSGRVTFENVTFGYTPDHLLMNGDRFDGRTGAESCGSRTYRSGKNNADQSFDALL